MITRIRESKTLTKHISCDRKCKIGGRKRNSNQMLNNDKCGYELKNLIKHDISKKLYLES